VDGVCVNVVMDDEMIPRQHDVQSGAGWMDEWMDGWMAWLCCIVIFFSLFPDRYIWRCVVRERAFWAGANLRQSDRIWEVVT
jgi:hypothetical protein